MPRRRGGREAVRSTKRKLSGRTKRTGDCERWEEGGGDKRNVESKKQKERRNKSAVCGSQEEKVRPRG